MGFVKAQVNFIQFNRAMVDLQRVTGQTMKQVVRSEVGHILKECAAKTKVATQDSVQRKAQLKAIKKLSYTQAPDRGDVSVNSGWRKNSPYGRVWIKVRSGSGRKNYILARGPNFDFPAGSATLELTPGSRTGTNRWIANVRLAVGRVVPAVEETFEKALKSVGLARQSWVQIADSIGISLESVPGTNLTAQGLAKARAALASDGVAYVNGTARQYGDASKFIVQIINKLPYVRRVKMDAVLARAINSRTTKFYNAARQGVFNSAKKTLSKYPGLFVS